MLPFIQEGDYVRIIKVANYPIGDIVVYVYKGELLVHRLVGINNERIYCKGDNSFRIEDIEYKDIIGKVIEIVRNEEKVKLPCVDITFCCKSLKVGKEFVKLGRDKVRIKQNKVYRDFLKDVNRFLY